MWHLDSNVVIAFLSGSPTLKQPFSDCVGQMAISSLVLAELLFGARNSARPAANLIKLRSFSDLVNIVDFDPPCAEAYGQVRLDLRKKGRPSSDMDMLIASVAIARGATLVTHNMKHFEMIEGLRLEDWMAAS
jgi:tRNA(fMet)-specific endonuclease VapC